MAVEIVSASVLDTDALNRSTEFNIDVCCVESYNQMQLQKLYKQQVSEVNGDEALRLGFHFIITIRHHYKYENTINHLNTGFITVLLLLFKGRTQ